MWIFCCGMQRSGSTLQFQIAAHLVEEAGRGTRVPWVPAEEFPRLRQEYAATPGWKVLKTHTCTEAMIEEFQRSGAKGLYVFRDLRDVATSTITKYGVTFAQLWDSRFLHRCLANERRWTALPGVLVSQYEEMVADLTTEVGRIADHLGLTVSRTRCAEVAADYGLERQRARIVEARRGGRLLRQGFLGAQFDPYTNLHTDHIATGRVGTWQSCLSLTEVAVIEDWARHWLRAHGYALTVGQPQRSLRRLLYAGGRFTFRLLARSKRAARARAPA